MKAPALALLIAALLSAAKGNETFAVPIPAGEKGQTTWDISALSRPPRFYPVTEPGYEPKGGIRAVFYEGLPFQGHPTRVFAWIGIPPASHGRVPGIVLVHGGSGTAHRSWVEAWMDRGYAAVAMDTGGAMPVILPSGVIAPRRHADAGPSGWGGFKTVDEPIADQWMYHAVGAVILGHSLLRSLPGVDPDRTGLTGISWGGIIAEIVAGVDQRLKFVVPVYACGFLGEDSAWIEPIFRPMGRPQALKWLRLWDSSQYMCFATMPMLFCTGTNDPHFPIDSWQRTYRESRGPVTLSLKTVMPHGNFPLGDPVEITVFADSVVRDGSPLAAVVNQGREGERAWADYSCRVPMAKAELLSTTSEGPWLKRPWTRQAARIDHDRRRVEATLPQRTTSYFFSLIDDRGCMVSSEHREIK